MAKETPAMPPRTLKVRSQPSCTLLLSGDRPSNGGSQLATLLTSLTQFLAEGGRKIDTWTAQHRVVLVAFDAPGDDPRAFANANTLDELRALEKMETGGTP